MSENERNWLWRLLILFVAASAVGAVALSIGAGALVGSAVGGLAGIGGEGGIVGGIVGGLVGVGVLVGAAQVNPPSRETPPGQVDDGEPDDPPVDPINSKPPPSDDPQPGEGTDPIER